MTLEVEACPKMMHSLLIIAKGDLSWQPIGKMAVERECVCVCVRDRNYEYLF